jgi:hypothetical protein
VEFIGRRLWNSYAAPMRTNSNSYARPTSNADAASAAAHRVDMGSLFFLGLGLSGVALLLWHARSSRRRQQRIRDRSAGR